MCPTFFQPRKSLFLIRFWGRWFRNRSVFFFFLFRKISYPAELAAINTKKIETLKPKGGLIKLKNQIKQIFVEFCQSTTIHGFPYLIENNRSWIEK